jgi:predicted TPR repeat methyltransferase
MRASSPPHVFSRERTVRPVSIEKEERTIIGLLEQGRLLEAERMARDLIARAPVYGFGWKAHGLILSLMGRKQEALPLMQQAAKLLPMDPEAFINLAALFMEFKQWTHAEACLQHAMKLAPNNARIQDMLIEALRNLDRPSDLLPLLERKLALTPEDDGLRHQVAMLSGQQTEAAPATYVKHLFDDYADTFEEHLCQTLAYETPWQLTAMLPDGLKAGQHPNVLDLGCGTGLMAQALAMPCARITGVDLSSKMLDKARAKGLYQELCQADVPTYLRQASQASFDIIFSADVFVYLGQLDEVFQEVARLLVTGGVFAFSVEDLRLSRPAPGPQDLERGYRLLPSGRYAHAEAYVSRLALESGLSRLSMQSLKLRRDSAGDIQGLLFVFQR